MKEFRCVSENPNPVTCVSEGSTLSLLPRTSNTFLFLSKSSLRNSLKNPLGDSSHLAPSRTKNTCLLPTLSVQWLGLFIIIDTFLNLLVDIPHFSLEITLPELDVVPSNGDLIENPLVLE